MATIIEIQEDKIENLSEYTEKVLHYGGKLMQCIESLSKKSKYNEYYDRKKYDKDRWDDEPRNSRYY
jgi:hypothetical protein